MKRFSNFFLIVVSAILVLVICGTTLGGSNVKVDIQKQVKKAIKDGKALKSMEDLAIISVWGVNWVTRGSAGPGTIGYSENIERHRSWMPELLNNFKPQLVSGLESAFKKTTQNLKPISFIINNANYKAFTPVQTEPKKGRGLLLGQLEGFKFIDDNPDDIAAVSKNLDVDGVITIRYYILPSLLPLKKNKVKVWMKIFTKDGNLVWFGKMYGEFSGSPPKMRKLESMNKLLSVGNKEAMKNMATLYQKSFKKAK